MNEFFLKIKYHKNYLYRRIHILWTKFIRLPVLEHFIDFFLRRHTMVSAYRPVCVTGLPLYSLYAILSNLKTPFSTFCLHIGWSLQVLKEFWRILFPRFKSILFFEKIFCGFFNIFFVIFSHFFKKIMSFRFPAEALGN